MESAAQHYMDTGDYAAATSLLQAKLRVDPCNRKAAKLLLKCETLKRTHPHGRLRNGRKPRVPEPKKKAPRASTPTPLSPRPDRCNAPSPRGLLPGDDGEGFLSSTAPTVVLPLPDVVERILMSRTDEDVLQLPNVCPARDVTRAYRQLARATHPDMNTHPRAAEAFNRIHTAHEAILASGIDEASGLFRRSQALPCDVDVDNSRGDDDLEYMDSLLGTLRGSKATKVSLDTPMSPRPSTSPRPGEQEFRSPRNAAAAAAMNSVRERKQQPGQEGDGLERPESYVDRMCSFTTTVRGFTVRITPMAATTTATTYPGQASTSRSWEEPIPSPRVMSPIASPRSARHAAVPHLPEVVFGRTQQSFRVAGSTVTGSFTYVHH
eukprot:PhM_4_TR9585/c0_g1_i1/m.31418